MPTLIIRIAEKHINPPDHPENCIAGFESSASLEFSENEHRDHALLPYLAPLIEMAIDTVLDAALGPTQFRASGKLGDSERAAIQHFTGKTEDAFPEEELETIG